MKHDCFAYVQCILVALDVLVHSDTLQSETYGALDLNTLPTQGSCLSYVVWPVLGLLGLVLSDSIRLMCSSITLISYHFTCSGSQLW